MDCIPPRTDMRPATRRESGIDPRKLAELVDAALADPCETNRRALFLALNDRSPHWGCELLRRRATALMRRARNRTQSILDARNRLMLEVYMRAVPSGWFSAWSDGSNIRHATRRCAGIGGLVLDPAGSVIAQFSRPAGSSRPFETEVAALAAVLALGSERGAHRMRVHTDCPALTRMWSEQRSDERLAAILEHAPAFRQLEIRTIPRLHNPQAHALARRAAVVDCGHGT